MHGARGVPGGRAGAAAGRGISPAGAPGDWLVARFRDGRALGWATTRAGGASTGRWASMNLGDHVGDDVAAVLGNRTAFGQAIGARPAWLTQVHGTKVVRIGRPSPRPSPAGAGEGDAGAQPWLPPVAGEGDAGAQPRLARVAGEGDASVTTDPGVACVVLVADCLPVLFAAPDGRGVAAAHAGWRGLAGGVLEATVAALCDAAACEPRDLDAWLGPCIGRDAFEVGADVLGAFGADPLRPPPTFTPAPRAGKWLADLPRLARDRLEAAGVGHIVDDGALCTVADVSRFFSFRRDGVTGRMAAAVRLPARADGR